ncbi:lactate utilization protein C [Streptomyces hainanensis]|uniref:Lactate utilization protein C n=1 Tax=Streptomyces hainanensis TaxID=402648 RepID=A0A4R4THC0_9ACTN|nr:lactate utilization protein C [Streptomyces hainanensis]
MILARVRRALVDVPAEEGPADVPVPRDYLTTHSPADPVRTLAENLADYRAVVHHADPAGLPALIADRLAERGTRTLVVPPGLPPEWLSAVVGAPGDPGIAVRVDSATDSPSDLDAADSVLTGCALAVAETGTIVLDGGPDQGRRRITLVPDHHVCVIRAPEQVVDSLPQALPRLDPARPGTWISGPSATSDIELNRVEGVHGPRTLEVILVHI